MSQREEEVEVEQVLPEELEAMLEERPPRSRLQETLQKIFLQKSGGRLQELLGRLNGWLDGLLAGKSGRGIDRAAIDSRAVSRLFAARLWRAATRESALYQSQKLDREDFSQLLQPLSSAEVLMLQKEVEADATVFSRIEVVRQTAIFQQRKAFLVAMIVGIFFALLAGPVYITETIYGSGLPSWIPLSQEVRDWFAALFFTLGILLPLFAVFQVAEAVRIMLVYREAGDTEIRKSWMLPLVLCVVALIFLLLGGILPALGLLLFSSFWLSAERSRRIDDLQ